MSYGSAISAESAEPSVELAEGWHCSHLYYRFDRGVLAGMGAVERQSGCDAVVAALDPAGPDALVRMQTSVVSGHKADFGLMLLDPNPLRIDAVHQRLMASPLGPALVPTYSFVSITEVSEYVPTVEQYGDRLEREGEDRSSPAFQAKVRAYAAREPMMRKARLTPELPAWPALCFYPMNKKRKVGENWFLLPFAKRNELMAEHAQRDRVRGKGVTTDHGRRRSRGLGMGRYAVGPDAAIPQGDRLPHAIRRGQRPVRGVRAFLYQLCHVAA